MALLRRCLFELRQCSADCGEFALTAEVTRPLPSQLGSEHSEQKHGAHPSPNESLLPNERKAA